jgi:hypothetical protein
LLDRGDRSVGQRHHTAECDADRQTAEEQPYADRGDERQRWSTTLAPFNCCLCGPIVHGLNDRDYANRVISTTTSRSVAPCPE